MTLLEKRAQRAKLVADARKIVDQADKEKRSMTAEENQTFDAHMAEVDKLGAEVETEERALDQRKKLEAAEAEMRSSRGRQTDTPSPGETHSKPELRTRFRGLTRRQYEEIEHRASPEYAADYDNYLYHGIRSANLLPAEYRDLQAGVDIQAGYLIAPIEYVDKLIIFKNNLVFIRQLATKYTVTDAQGMGAPSLDTDVSAPVWTSEIATGNADTATRVGKRELFPHPLAKQIKLSRKLLRINTVSAQDLVMNRLGYQFGVTEEATFMTGTGAEQPLGVFTASAQGIDTSRDVSTAGTAVISADDLIEAKYTLKQQYLSAPELRWIAHRVFVKAIRKLKDGMGQYIWTTGLGIGKPDTLLDVPLLMSEYAPSTTTSGNYAAILGDFSFYWIADALDMSVQRLDELYAATNQVGFIGRQEVDGMPVLPDAFVRLKLS